jgi:hypothetical protein
VHVLLPVVHPLLLIVLQVHHVLHPPPLHVLLPHLDQDPLLDQHLLQEVQLRLLLVPLLHPVLHPPLLPVLPLHPVQEVKLLHFNYFL